MYLQIILKVNNPDLNISFYKNTIEKESKICDLDEARRFLLREHEILCSNSFIKSIIKNGKRVFTYDWETIFMLAKQQGILEQFYTNNQHLFK